MKRFVKFSLAVASAILAVSCNVQEPEAPVVPETPAAEENVIVFTANFEATKAQIGTDGKFTWEAGDVIRITDNIGYWEVITLTDEDISDDGASATFKTTKLSSEATDFYAVYPFDNNTYLNDDKNYVFDNTSLSKSKVLSNVSACTKDETSFCFHSASCLIRFDTDIEFAVAELEGPSLDDNVFYQKKYTVSPSTGEVVSIADDGYHSITYDRTDGEDGPYYFEFAPGLTWEKGFVITLSDAAGKTLGSFTYDKSLTTVRGKVYNISNFDERLDCYIKVASNLVDWSGEYLLVAPDVNMVLSGFSSTSTVYGLGSEVEIINDRIMSSSTNDAYKLSISPASEGSSYVIKLGDKYLNWITGNSLSTADAETDNSRWTFSYSNGNVLIKNVSDSDNERQIWWNNSSPRFANYKNSSVSTSPANYLATALYRLGGGGTPVPPTPKYTITLPDGLTGGTVTSDKTEAEAGEIVTITAEPADGYQLASLTANVSGEALEDDVLTFTMPEENVTVYASFKEISLPSSGTVTITLGKTSITGSYSSGSFTVDGFGFGYTNWIKSTDFIQAKANTNSSLFNSSSFPGEIKSITIVQDNNRTARPVSVCGGKNKQPSTLITSPETSYEMYFSLEGKGCQYFSIATPGNAVYFESISITYGPVATLQSVAVTGQPTTLSYCVGDTFDPTGLVVTGTYDDSTQKQITDGIEWTITPSIISAETTSVDVVATIDGVSSPSYTVNGITITEAGLLQGLPVSFAGSTMSVNNSVGSATISNSKGGSSHNQGNMAASKNDYWLFTIPVKNLAKDTKVNIAFTDLRNNKSSSNGTYTFVYYSSVNDSEVEFSTYSEGNTNPTAKDFTFTMGHSVSNGTLYIKMKMTAGGSTSAGNHYLGDVTISVAE